MSKKNKMPPAAVAPQKTGIRWKWVAAIAAILFAVVFAIYMNTFWYGLVFNDTLTLQTIAAEANNPKSLATTPMDPFIRPFTQPWVRASFITDMQHYTSDFGWYHLVNVWLHFSSALTLATLVFVVALRNPATNKNADYPYALAGLSGLIYACHPLAAQTATYLSARYAGLGAANFLLALLFYSFIFNSKGALRVWSSLLTVAFTLMCLDSSEVGLALAPSMVALFFLLKPAKISWRDWPLDHPFLIGITVAVAIALPIFVMAGFEPVAIPNSYGLPKLNAAAYYATQFKSLLTYYTRCFVVPFGLSIDPPYATANGFADVGALLGVVLFAGIVFGAYYFRRNAVMFFGIWLTLAGFLPHALVIQQDAVSDAAIYLAVGGMSIALAWFLFEVWPGELKSVVPKAVAVLIVLAGLSVVRNLDFRNDDALVAATLKSNPRSELSTATQAMLSLKSEKYEEAGKYAQQLVNDNPNQALAQYVLGQSLLRRSDAKGAIAALEKSAKLSEEQHLPTKASAKFALAEAYLDSGQEQKASATLNQAIGDDPHNGRGVYLLGLMSLRKKQYEPAMAYLQQALQMGVAEARTPAVRALMGMNRYDAALGVAQKIVTTNDTPENQLLLGNAAVGANDLPTAEKALKAALKANPQSAEAMALLSILYEKRGDKVLADSYHNDAVKRDPEVFSKILLPKKSEEAPEK